MPFPWRAIRFGLRAIHWPTRRDVRKVSWQDRSARLKRLSESLLGFHSCCILLPIFAEETILLGNFVRSFLITMTVQAPAEVAPMAARVAAAMQTGHISCSSNPKS